MPSPVLLHGPHARSEAVQLSLKVGRLIADPIGDDGLKVDASREIVALAGNAGVGDKPPVVIVGPLDRATPEAGDALLKTLEDLSTAPLRIILWADYYGGVIGTIRSRTLERWCPPEPGWVSPFMDAPAEALYTAWERRDPLACMEALREHPRDWQALLQGFCEYLAERQVDDPLTAVVWDVVRPLMDGKGSYLNAATALLKVLEENPA